MAETLQELETRRAALQKAIDSGALSVRHGDTSIQYRSLREMLDALDAILRRIANYGTTERVRSVRIYPSRDY